MMAPGAALEGQSGVAPVSGDTHRKVNPPPGFWRRADTHYPRPLSPLGRSLLLPAANAGFRHMCARFGLLVETVEERVIGGRVYLRVVPLGGRERRPPPAWALPFLIRLHPSLKRRVGVCVEAVRTDLAGRCIERWHGEWQPELQDRLARLRDAETGSMSDAELDEHLAAINDLIHRSQRIHMLLNHSVNVLLAELAFAARDLLGWNDDRTLSLVAGLSDASSAPARAVSRLAEAASTRPEVKALLAQGAAAEAVLAGGREFAAAFGEFQRWYGMRTIGYDVADPTLAERPDLILRQVHDAMSAVRQGSEPGEVAARRRDAREAAERVLADGAPEYAERLERALRQAELAYPVREEHGVLDTMMPLALARHAALELGRRLSSRGQIRDPADVFFLEIDEARFALSSGATQSRRIHQRKQERERELAQPGPASYGEPSPLPTLDPLPAEVRFMHEAVDWSYQRVFAPDAGSGRPEDPSTLRGKGASPGRFTGTARVIRDESGFDRIRDRDVLVCPTASPVWSVLFPRLGALVTDTGGTLSHCAIVAREFGIPAVVATGNATHTLRDGQTVTVDGAAGTVMVHAEKGQ
jgi:rifampicin phosphotransferase